MVLKKYIVVVSIILGLLLAGCSNGNNNTTQNGFSGDSYKGGTEGVTINFENGMPPKSVRDQGLQPFTIRLKLLNEGEYNIKENDSAYIKLAGFDPSEFDTNTTVKEMPALRGYTKQGDRVTEPNPGYVVFGGLKYVNDISAGNLQRTIYAYGCYPYQTRAVGLVCVGDNTVPSVDDTTRNCEMDGKKNLASSGAPVSVKNLRESPYGEHSVQFQFDIVKESKDINIYKPDVLGEGCSINGSSLSSTDTATYKNRIKYTIDSGIEGLNCEGTGSNSNTVLLSDNKYTVTCVQDTEGENERDSPIKIKLKYDVVDRVSKSLNIEHISQ